MRVRRASRASRELAAGYWPSRPETITIVRISLGHGICFTQLRSTSFSDLSILVVHTATGVWRGEKQAICPSPGQTQLPQPPQEPPRYLRRLPGCLLMMVCACSLGLLASALPHPVALTLATFARSRAIRWRAGWQRRYAPTRLRFGG